MYQAPIWHMEHRGGSGVAPALEELTVQRVQTGPTCAVEDRHAAAAALREGNMRACGRPGEVTHPAAGTREGFRGRCCLDGDVRDEQELAREGKQEGKGKYVYGV